MIVFSSLSVALQDPGLEDAGEIVGDVVPEDNDLRGGAVEDFCVCWKGDELVGVSGGVEGCGVGGWKGGGGGGGERGYFCRVRGGRLSVALSMGCGWGWIGVIDVVTWYTWMR